MKKNDKMNNKKLKRNEKMKNGKIKREKCTNMKKH